ncbi:hypothetical protein L7F22_023958 [Adiantum nelumboides]|nr:hypothetical protein [Adiantum nelumboides]
MAGTTHQAELLPLPWHLPHAHSQDVFTEALQELRNLRPLLHSAADYYEMAFLHSNQKNTIIQSLQDYCAKVLVTSVDHLGTVASQLDDSLSLLAVELLNVEIRTVPIAARLSACHEKTDCEALSQCQLMTSRKPVYLKHYDSKGKHFLSLPQLSPGKVEEIFQLNAGSDSGTLKSLSWYLAFESSSPLPSKPLQAVKRSTSVKGKTNFCNDQVQLLRSLSNGQNPRFNQGCNSSIKARIGHSGTSLQFYVTAATVPNLAELQKSHMPKLL